MSAFLSLNGARVISGRVTLPRFGAWTADVVLAESAPIQPAVALLVGDLTLQGSVVRMASFAGSRSARIVGGAAGWRKVIPPRGYTHEAGVRLSTVLSDAARECGERISVASDRIIGYGYARKGGKAERVLRRWLGGQWWIDNAGVTQTGARVSTPIASAFTVEAWSGAKGHFVIATEAYKDWQPGRSFSAPTVTVPQVISSVTIVAENDGKVRLDVLTSAITEDRLRQTVRELIQDELDRHDATVLVEYTVRAATSSTIDAEPTDLETGWPTLIGIPLRSGLIGETVKPAVGKRALIAFVNGDPSKFVCLHVDGKPQEITLDASTSVKLGAGALPVARSGDFAGPFPVVTTQTKVLG